MRRLVSSLFALAASTAGVAAPTDDDMLRPTLPPQASLTEAPPRLGSARDDAWRLLGFRRWSASESPSDPSIPAEDALNRPADTPSLLDWRYLAASGRGPDLLAAAASDLWRRQGREEWRQNGWVGKGGWEIDFAPTGSTMVYVRDFYSEAARKKLVEGKLGFAIFDDLSFAGVSLGKIYVGPFAIFHGWRLSEDLKIGAHVTLGKIGLFHIGVAGGYAKGLFGSSGAFGLMESSLRF